MGDLAILRQVNRTIEMFLSGSSVLYVCFL